MRIRIVSLLLVSALWGTSWGFAQEQDDRPLTPCTESPSCAYEERLYPHDADLLFTTVRRAIDRMSPVDLSINQDSLRLTAAFRVFFFLDDLSVALEQLEEGTQLYIRSASRSAFWDAGTNRRRLNGFFDRLESLLDQDVRNGRS